jgi:hypothetical protein
VFGACPENWRFKGFLCVLLAAPMAGLNDEEATFGDYLLTPGVSRCLQSGHGKTSTAILGN